MAGHRLALAVRLRQVRAVTFVLVTGRRRPLQTGPAICLQSTSSTLGNKRVLAAETLKFSGQKKVYRGRRPPRTLVRSYKAALDLLPLVI